MSVTRRGFTLIELLIVVAIIAILAAIAVPNFLEAQMRAKVSRCVSDQRSVALAMESYKIDNNYYPKTLTPEVLTTPIGYLSTLPIDTFKTDDSRQITRTTFEYVGYKKSPVWQTEGLFLDFFSNHPPFIDPYKRPSQVPSYLSKPNAMWELKSWGPDRLWKNCAANGGNGDDYSLAYDPSNGTVSHGDICRFGP